MELPSTGSLQQHPQPIPGHLGLPQRQQRSGHFGLICCTPQEAGLKAKWLEPKPMPHTRQMPVLWTMASATATQDCCWPLAMCPEQNKLKPEREAPPLSHLTPCPQHSCWKSPGLGQLTAPSSRTQTRGKVHGGDMVHLACLVPPAAVPGAAVPGFPIVPVASSFPSLFW